MVRGYFPKLRDAALVGQARGVCPSTVVDGYRTPRMEHASGRWPKRAWHVSRKDYALSLGFHYGVRFSYSSLRSAISAILPRYITTMRSLMWRTTERSWATKR